MLRAVIGGLTTLVVGGVCLWLADQPAAPAKNPHEYPATLVNVDVGKKALTFKTATTLPLGADVKVLGEDNKPETLKQFKEAMDKEDDKSILIVEAADGKHVLALRDLPPPEPKHADNTLHAALVSVDLDKNTVTFKAKGKDGKEAENTLPLAKDAKVVGEDKKPETLQQFKDAMDKEDDKSIQVVEDQDGKQIVSLTDLPPEIKKYKAALVSVDLDKNTISYKSKSGEASLPLAKDAKVLGEDKKPETLQQFKEAMDKEEDKSIEIIEAAGGKEIASLRDLPPEGKHYHAALVSIDLDKGAVTFKAKGKDGKETENTLPLAKDAKVRGEDNKPETLQQFKEAMDKEDDKSIFIAEEADGKQIASIRDLPPDEKQVHAALVSVDLDKGAITFEVEKTLPLAKGAKILGEDAQPEKLKQFKEAEEKEKDKAIVIVEDDEGKHITSVAAGPAPKENK